MKLYLPALFIALLSCAALASTSPNIIIILTDDQGYADASCYGSADIQTPHIDKLAASGVRFTNGYITHPYCSPSRAGILSGKHQQSFGHEHNPRYDEADDITGIDPNTPLFPSYFKQKGYKSAAFGKWHLGAGKPFRPTQRGFDHFWGFLGGGHHFFKWKKNGKGYDSPIWIDGKPTNTPINYITDDLTDAAIKFIEKEQNSPFLIYLAYNAPHSPNHAKPEDITRFKHIKHPKRRIYAAMMASVDDNVGRLTKKLDDLKLRENTIIYYLSDNGGRRDLGDNRPLRGNKGWLHEGGIRVPFIISYPSHIPAGQTYKKPISSLDILPTSLAAANITTPGTLEGANLLPHLTGKISTPPHTTLHWRVCGGKGYALRKDNWKLIKDVYHDTPELYDLAADPEERVNLASQNPEKVQMLLQSHQQWNDTLEEPRWTEGHYDGARNEWKSSEKNGFRVWGSTWFLQK
jgi:arylsulfatase A-like enzyme